jgi:hypothetical protein
MASSQLLWQLVKNNHAFLHKGLHGAQFSSEPGNLYNINSYKYSGQCFLAIIDDAFRLPVESSSIAASPSACPEGLSPCCKEHWLLLGAALLTISLLSAQALSTRRPCMWRPARRAASP